MMRLVRLLAVVVVLVCLVSGGASGGSAPARLTLQLSWVVQTQDAGYYVALDKGWYREEGIDLTIEPGGPDVIQVQRLVTRQADVAVVYLSQTLTARAEGAPIVRIGQLFQTSGVVLISRKALGVSKPEQLRGHQIGVWFGGNEYHVLALLNKFGIDPHRDVELVKQSFSMDPFLEGKLQVASAWRGNELIVVEQSGIGEKDLNIIDPSQYGFVLYEDGWTVTAQTLQSRKDALVHWMVATLRGWRWALDNPKEATLITMKYIPKGQPAKFAHQFAQMQQVSKLICTAPGGLKLHGLGYLDPAGWDINVGLLRKYAGLNKPLGTDAYTYDIWNSAIGILKQRGIDYNCPSRLVGG
jgi:NitT/TauT family transport system substrate-binding protein